ncbi:MAG: lipid-A-disaccharide synthase [Bacteroidales bacterium]|nr:lipid-A-disaccharide synthase [Bacteroidales bacterium]MBN2631932.1 lipid-A-disaccharide synthase [Bacteroidales bacterium]
MKYFIIAGEQSGDLHGSNLIRELIRSDNDAEVVCWGGDLMEAAGARLLMHYRDTAFMGFTAVVKSIRTIRRNLKLCKEQIIEHSPGVIILIDYPGFNLRIAEFASCEGLKVFYYISPKFWAWNEGRVRKVKKYVSRMFIILPFEKEFYEKHGITVEYHGNPLVDEVEKQRSAMPQAAEILSSLQLDTRPVIALMAGSRKHEVEKILPVMLKTVKHFPDHQFVLAGVKNISDGIYNRILKDSPVTLIREKTYEILSIARAALVKSGTSTLEAALFGVPQVVCYRNDFLTMLLGWFVIRVRYISLVNLIVNREVVRELLQYSVTEKNLVSELNSVLPGGTKRRMILEGYLELKEKLGPAGASSRIAGEMLRELKGYPETERGA